jgi:hypothetical protein
MKTDWNTIPNITMDLGKLSDPAQICRVMNAHNIDKYLYKVMYKGIVIKFGMSADNSRAFGERLYRQIGHSAGWPTGLRLTGSSGADWRIIEEDFKNLYGFDLDRQHMTVKVWDVTNYNFRSVNSRTEILSMEAELIDNYVNAVGEKPIGNINDEINNKERYFVSKEIMANIFENYEIFLK